MRTAALARRAALARSAGAAGAEGLARNLLALAVIPAGARISGFWPMGDEIDLRPAFAGFAARGHPLALPVTGPRGTVLVFREWTAGAPLERERFGTMAPPASAPAVRPDVLLVPLLAFDRKGWRLGYGGGYFDRTLAALRAGGPVLAIGVGFAGQEVPEVPRGATDQPLDAVATEREAFLVARPSSPEPP